MEETRFLSRIYGRRSAPEPIQSAFLQKQETLSTRLEYEDPALPEREALSISVRGDGEEEAQYPSPARQSKTLSLGRREQNACWATGFGEFIRQKEQNSNPTFSGTSAGAVVGYEHYDLDQYPFKGIIQGSAAYIQNSVQQKGGVGNARSKGFSAAVFGTGYLGDAYIEAGLLGAYNRYIENRLIAVPGPAPILATATGRYNVWQILPHLKGGYDWMCGDWGVIEPFAALDLAVNVQSGFTERGAGALDMAVHSNISCILKSEVGINVYRIWESDTSVWIFEPSASYINKFPFGTQMSAALALVPTTPGPSAFSQATYSQKLNLFGFGAELFYKHKKTGIYTSATYNGELGNRYFSNDLQGTLGVFF